jgi:hypothetical protein
MTEEEALTLATRILATSDPIRLYPFEFGWLAKRHLSWTPENKAGRWVRRR